MSTKFRKKPIIVMAFQMTKERRWDNSEWPNWLHEAWNFCSEKQGSLYCKNASDELYIKTLEGDHIVDWNDYIIKGIHGELYPCKPDIFEKTYEDAYSKNLTASEALYGFMGWLASRQEPVTFSAKHDASIAVELIKEFSIANSLESPRDNYSEMLWIK